MTYLKATAIILMFLFIVGGVFYSGVLNSIKTLVSQSNQGFIAYLPNEGIAIVSIIVFGLLIGLAYSFFKD